ncbi:MAG: hypothetical protein PHH36_14100 [Sideroxydans sp.]|nr:hypothetical protein [Sideroxydans sp.]
MKKFTVLIALALLVGAGIGYAQEPTTAAYPIFKDTNPFSTKVENLRLNMELTFGDKREMSYTPIPACALVDTTVLPGDTFFKEDEVRSFAVEAKCGVPKEAEHVTLRIVATGVRVPTWWNIPGVGFYTTTPNSASDGVGMMLGGIKPAIVFVESVGKTNAGAAVVELKNIPIPFGAVKGVEVVAKYGDAHALIEVVGYTTPKTGSTATASAARMAMYWAGDWTPATTYGKGDMVTSASGVWICTASGPVNCAGWALIWSK